MMASIEDYINKATREQLVSLRAKINGKLGKRTISPAAQSKMQAGRVK